MSIGTFTYEGTSTLKNVTIMCISTMCTQRCTNDEYLCLTGDSLMETESSESDSPPTSYSANSHLTEVCPFRFFPKFSFSFAIQCYEPFYSAV